MTTFNLQDFWPYRLSILSETFSQLLAEEYQAKYGLSVSQWRVLLVVSLRSPTTAAEICKETRLDKMTVSRAVRYLIHRKLISIADNPDDRRSRHLNPSSNGREICDNVIPALEAYQSQVLDSLTEIEKITLEAIFFKLMHKIREIEKSRKI